MITISEFEYTIILSFASIGMLLTLAFIYYFIAESIKTIASKIRKACYQCGDDSEKTKRYKAGYYCNYCMENRAVEINKGFE